MGPPVKRERPPKLPWYRQPSAGVRWQAGSDRVAHAARPGVRRTLCEIPVVDPRYGWPTALYCSNCIAVLGEVPSTLDH